MSNCNLTSMISESSNMSEISSRNVTESAGKGSGIKDSFKVLKLIIAITVTLLIICNNIINMIVLTKMRDMNKRMKILLFSLSTSDFCLGITVCLPGVVAGILGYWPFSIVACQVTGTMNGVAIAVSLWSLMAISIERSVLIRKVVVARNDKTILQVIIGVVFIWAFNVTFFAFPIFLEDDYIYYRYDPAVISCSFRWKSTAYFIIAKFLFPVLSGTVILVSNIRIHFILREAQLFRKNVFPRMESSAVQSTENIPSPDNNKREVKENQVNEIYAPHNICVHGESGNSTRNLLSSKLYNVKSVSFLGPSSTKGNFSENYKDTQESQGRVSHHSNEHLTDLSGRTLSRVNDSTNKTTSLVNFMPRSTLRRNLKARLLLVCTSAAFFLTTSPYMISSLIDHFLVQWESTNGLKFAALWILNTNSFINVYVYSIIYNEFRNHCRNLFSVLIFGFHGVSNNRCHCSCKVGSKSNSERMKKTSQRSKHRSYPLNDRTASKSFEDNLEVTDQGRDKSSYTSGVESIMGLNQMNGGCNNRTDHVIQVVQRERPVLVPRNDAGVPCTWLPTSDIPVNKHNNTTSNDKSKPLIAISSLHINKLPSIDV